MKTLSSPSRQNTTLTRWHAGKKALSERGVIVKSAASSAPQVDNFVRWSKPEVVKQVKAPPGETVIILPGFGNNSKDYLAPFDVEEEALATSLKVRGFSPYVVPVARKDWFKVARSVLTIGFWSSSLTTHPGYTWYLDMVADTVKQAREETGAEKVHLVCHSAGGWLARAFLGDSKYREEADASSTTSQRMHSTHNPVVKSIVTLGTPHFPPAPEIGRDMTGGAQTWVNKQYPGAFFAEQGVRYVCVAGRAVQGDRSKPRTTRGPRTLEEYAYDSYSQVCGEGQGIMGDCVVPLKSALLQGAQHIILDGVMHSMSRVGTFEESSGLVWYGSPDVVDLWLPAMLGEHVDMPVPQGEQDILPANVVQ